MHICVSKLTIIGFNNGLSPGRRPAITSNNAGLLLIQTMETFENVVCEMAAIFISASMC